MIRFALIAASTLGFFLTAAFGNLMVPLLRAFQGRNAPQAPQQRQEQSPEQRENAPPPQVPTLGGLCLMVGVLAAVGVGWTAACAAEPQLLGAEGRFSTRLLLALFGALLFGGVGLADDLARLRRRLGLPGSCLWWAGGLTLAGSAFLYSGSPENYLRGGEQALLWLAAVLYLMGPKTKKAG